MNEAKPSALPKRIQRKRMCSCGPNDACSDCGRSLTWELHKIRQVTASDPNHIFCRQATIMIEVLMSDLEIANGK